MFETLRRSVTVEIVPRLAFLVWAFYHIPLIHWTGGVAWTVNVVASLLVALCVGMDVHRWLKTDDRRRVASFWADRRARHSDPEIYMDDELL